MKTKNINYFDDRVNFVSVEYLTTWGFNDYHKNIFINNILKLETPANKTLSFKLYNDTNEEKDVTNMIFKDGSVSQELFLHKQNYHKLELEGELKYFDGCAIRVTMYKSTNLIMIDYFSLNAETDLIKLVKSGFFDVRLNALEITSYIEVALNDYQVANIPIFLEKTSTKEAAEQLKYCGRLYYKGNEILIDRNLSIEDIYKYITIEKNRIDERSGNENGNS